MSPIVRNRFLAVGTLMTCDRDALGRPEPKTRRALALEPDLRIAARIENVLAGRDTDDGAQE